MQEIATSGTGPNRGADDTLELTTLVSFVKKRASGSFGVKVLGAALGFAIHLAIARLIGVSAYGIFALMLSWVSVLAVVAQFGQDNGVLHFLPKYTVREQWGLIKGLRRASGLLVFGVSILIAGGGIAYVHWGIGKSSVTLTRTFDIGFVLLPVLAQLQQSGAFIRALKQAAESDLYVSIVRPVTLLFLVAIVYVLNRTLLSAPIAAVLSLISAVLALVWSASRLRRHWPSRSRSARPEYQVREWAETGAQLSVLSVMMVASTAMGSLVIGGFLGASQVGPYYAAVQMAAFGSFGFTAINSILAPMIAEHYAAGRLELLEHLMRRAARMTFVSTSVLTGILAILGRYVLGMFGHRFTVAYVPLLILLLGEWLSTCAGSVGFLLTMTRFQKQAPAIFLCGLVSTLILAVVLVPLWNLTGMAVSTVAGWLIWNVAALIFVHRKLRINPTIFQWSRTG